MGNYSSVMNRGPENFEFKGNVARVASNEQDAQRIIDFFKGWLPYATAKLKHDLEQQARAAADKRRRELELQRAREESLLWVNSRLKF